MEFRDFIRLRIKETIDLKYEILNNDKLLLEIEEAIKEICSQILDGKKLLVCGNGGSASDALHIAGELMGRFKKERKSIPCIALNSSNVNITAISNDYGFQHVFSRQIEGLMDKGDVLLGITTSGNSDNIVFAVEQVKKMGGKSIVLTGKDGGKVRKIADRCIIVPCDDTARIQEIHIILGHILCEIIEDEVMNCEK